MYNLRLQSRFLAPQDLDERIDGISVALLSSNFFARIVRQQRLTTAEVSKRGFPVRDFTLPAPHDVMRFYPPDTVMMSWGSCHDSHWYGTQGILSKWWMSSEGTVDILEMGWMGKDFPRRYSAPPPPPPSGPGGKGSGHPEPRPRKPERISRSPWGRALQGEAHGTGGVALPPARGI